MTWSVIILVPLTIAVAASAGPIASLLNPANPHAHCARASVVATTSTMLEVFAPQIILYGLSVVLFGLLQAYRRFTGPSLAPVVSSLVLIASFLPSCRWAAATRWTTSPSRRSSCCRSGPPWASPCWSWWRCRPPGGCT